MFTFLFPYQVLKVQCVFYSDSTSHFGEAVFYGLQSCMPLTSSVLDRPDRRWPRGSAGRKQYELKLGVGVLWNCSSAWAGCLLAGGAPVLELGGEASRSETQIFEEATSR